MFIPSKRVLDKQNLTQGYRGASQFFRGMEVKGTLQKGTQVKDSKSNLQLQKKLPQNIRNRNGGIDARPKELTGSKRSLRKDGV